jgi:hypothetical protein
MNVTRPKLLALAGGVAALTLVFAACSSSGKKASEPTTLGSKSTLSESRGYDCPDPAGDIGTDTGANSVGKLTQPSGIDMTHASAQVQGDNLVVSFQTVGDIATAPQPIFDVLQGDLSSATELTWELRAEPAVKTNPAGKWHVVLSTFKSGPEQKTELATPVTVNGNTLSYSVPMKDIPPIATLEWQFGTSSPQGDGPAFFDDCNSLKSQPSATGGTATTAAGAATSTTKG